MMIVSLLIMGSAPLWAQAPIPTVPLQIKKNSPELKLQGLTIDKSTKILTPTTLEKDFKKFSEFFLTDKSSQKTKFEGVFIRDIIQKYADTKVGTATLWSLDGQQIVLQKDEWTRYEAFIALKREGKPIQPNMGFSFVFDVLNYPNHEQKTWEQKFLMDIVRIQLGP